MYFRYYGLRNTWLDKCLISPVSEDILRATWQTGKNTVSISTTAPLPYSLITLTVNELKRVTVNDMENFNTVC